ncbi:acetate--CoA ligase family protein [Candidatus Woesearchaeota archaeon]|nr:acetate--CoA ligase family protein [Candidatus Woesearchaeota archaeon]
MKMLKEKEAEDFLEKKGFNVARSGIAKNYNEALGISSKLGFPVMLKVTNSIHKTNINGIKISNKENLEENFKQLRKKSPKILVQEYVDGLEMIAGLKKDPTFDHVIIFGLGGIYTEIIRDVSFRICPIELKDIKEMMQEIKGYKLLKGYRDKKFNIKSVENVILRLSKLAESHPNIEELDINPLIVNSKEAIIVDARIVMK